MKTKGIQNMHFMSNSNSVPRTNGKEAEANGNSLQVIQIASSTNANQ